MERVPPIDIYVLYSLLDNAPNYLVGCVIQKWLYLFGFDCVDISHLTVIVKAAISAWTSEAAITGLIVLYLFIDLWAGPVKKTLL